jgi:SAM-dependent methyltransferase
MYSVDDSARPESTVSGRMGARLKTRNRHPAARWSTRAAIVAVCALTGCFALRLHGQGRSDTQFPPSPPEVVAAMLKLAGVTKNDVVYDLGSGDGRSPIAAARTLGARGVGIEIDPELVKQARENARDQSVSDRVRFVQQDLFAADISEATVVTIYLLPSLNAKLLPKLNKELRPGTRVVSQSFDLGGPKPKATIDVGGRPVFLWVVPIR